MEGIRVRVSEKKKKRKKKRCCSAGVVAMGDEKSVIAMASRDRERDRELLISVPESAIDDASSKPSSSLHSGREV